MYLNGCTKLHPPKARSILKEIYLKVSVLIIYTKKRALYVARNVIIQQFNQCSDGPNPISPIDIAQANMKFIPMIPSKKRILICQAWTYNCFFYFLSCFFPFLLWVMGCLLIVMLLLLSSLFYVRRLRSCFKQIP